MKFKFSKEIFNIGRFTNKFKCHNELKKNVDPEVLPLIRKKRLKASGYKNTETRWIKKLEDKSWKARCKKAHQWVKHKLGIMEKVTFFTPNYGLICDLIDTLKVGEWFYVDNREYIRNDNVFKNYVFNHKSYDHIEFLGTLVIAYENGLVDLKWTKAWHSSVWNKTFPEYKNKVVIAVKLLKPKEEEHV